MSVVKFLGLLPGGSANCAACGLGRPADSIRAGPVPAHGSGDIDGATGSFSMGSNFGDYTGIGGAGANIGGGALSPGPSFGAGMGWESVASPNMDWGGMGSAPWDTGSSSSGFGNFGSDIGANLDQNFFSSK